MRSQIEGLPTGFHADRAADMIAPKLCDTEKRCEIVTEFGRLEQLSADWLRLWKAGARREIFQDFGWIRAFWKTYGQNMCVCSPVVFEGRKVCGILPLAVQRHTLQFLGAPGSDYNDILCEEHGAADVLRIALEGVLYLRGAWKTCILANLSSQSLVVRHLQDLPNHLKKRLNLDVRMFLPYDRFGGESRECPRSFAAEGKPATSFESAARTRSARLSAS